MYDGDNFTEQRRHLVYQSQTNYFVLSHLKYIAEECRLLCTMCVSVLVSPFVGQNQRLSVIKTRDPGPVIF